MKNLFSLFAVTALALLAMAVPSYAGDCAVGTLVAPQAVTQTYVPLQTQAVQVQTIQVPVQTRTYAVQQIVQPQVVQQVYAQPIVVQRQAFVQQQVLHRQAFVQQNQYYQSQFAPQFQQRQGFTQRQNFVGGGGGGGFGIAQNFRQGNGSGGLLGGLERVTGLGDGSGQVGRGVVLGILGARAFPGLAR